MARQPSGWKATILPLRVRTPWVQGGAQNFTVSHNFTASSSDALARRLPSGLKATLWTFPVCPLKVKTTFSLAKSHTFTVPSHDALARRLPSGLKAAPATSLSLVGPLSDTP